MLLIKPLSESLAKYEHRMGSRGPASAARARARIPRVRVARAAPVRRGGRAAHGTHPRVPGAAPHLYRVREVAAGEDHRLLDPEAYRAAAAN
ncbi:MAG: hypothetical protein OXC09_01680 [Truepera sp.]|nr:hypothetical protein [Truepera sp.]